MSPWVAAYAVSRRVWASGINPVARSIRKPLWLGLGALDAYLDLMEISNYHLGELDLRSRARNTPPGGYDVIVNDKGEHIPNPTLFGEQQDAVPIRWYRNNERFKF